ncbi:hypothetical protein NDU88_009369, partial [Pleurodeles waltl]
ETLNNPQRRIDYLTRVLTSTDPETPRRRETKRHSTPEARRESTRGSREGRDGSVTCPCTCTDHLALCWQRSLSITWLLWRRRRTDGATLPQ